MAIFATLRRNRANSVAVRVGAVDITYERLLADIMHAAAMLAAAGVDQTSAVGIRCGTLNSGHTYANWIAHLATFHLGATHVSIPDRASLAAVVQAGKIDCLIGSETALADAPTALRRIFFDVAPGTPLPPLPAPPDRSASASRLSLTSGTTGTPKFVRWDMAMMMARVAQVADGEAIGTDTILYCVVHLPTAPGFRYPIAVWMAGGCVLLPDDPDVRVRDAALGAANLIVASPTQLAERVAQFTAPWPGREQRTIVALGGRLPALVRERALATACATLLVSFGSTEAGSITLGPADLIDRHPGAAGFVRNGVTVEIVDAARNSVPAGEPGLLRIKSPVMNSGYEGAESERGSSQFDGGYFYPGDIGRLFDDGMLAIEGRISDTLNVGGWKVSALDLEARLSVLPGVDDLAACVMPMPGGDMLTFAVVTADGVDLTPVANIIRAQLPPGRRFHVVRLPSIPRNAMGRIPRALIARKLADLYAAADHAADA